MGTACDYFVELFLSMVIFEEVRCSASILTACSCWDGKLFLFGVVLFSLVESNLNMSRSIKIFDIEFSPSKCVRLSALYSVFSQNLG